jgi:hypothetical protein
LGTALEKLSLQDNLIAWMIPTEIGQMASLGE